MRERVLSADQQVSLNRSKLLDRVILVFFLFGIFWAVTLPIRVSESGFQNAQYSHFLAFIFLSVAVFFKKTIPYGLRLSFLILTFLFIGVAGLISYGLVGNAIVGLAIAVILASFFSTKKVTYGLFVFSVSAIFLSMYLFLNGIVVLTFDVNQYANSVSSWIALVLAFLTLTGFVISVFFILVKERDDYSDALKAQVEILTQHDIFLDSVINGIADPVFVKNEDHQLVIVNDAFCSLMGGDREQLLDNSNHHSLSKEQIDSFRQYDDIATSSEEATTNELTVDFAEQTRVISTTKSSFRNPITGKNSIVGVSRDVTDIRRVEQQLQQSQKMEAVGRLAGGVAHDFNNMLGVVLGYTDMMLAQADESHPFHVYLKEVRKAGERSAALTRQLLAFARKQVVTPKVLELDKTVATMTNMLQRFIGEDIDLRWQPGSGDWLIRVDPGQIDQILANLCVNAREAITDVGRVTIETDTVTIDESHRLEYPNSVPGEYVMLAVTDSGRGMAPDTLSKLFEPFFTTKEMGTGLGLATVYGIVEQNGGFLQVDSQPAEGSTFKVFLPRYVGEFMDSGQYLAAELTAERKESILLVEDEPAILEITATMLDSLGYHVTMAASPDKAIELAGAFQGELDLLISDVVMPEMNGRDLAQLLVAGRPTLKVLYMSGYTADVIGRHGVLEENVYFLQKPFSMAELSVKVREVLEEGAKTAGSGN